MRALAFIFALWMTLCLTLLGIAASISFNNYLEARRDLERKEQTEKMRLTIERGIDELTAKMPDFKVFKRGEESNGSSTSSSGRGMVRIVRD